MYRESIDKDISGFVEVWLSTQVFTWTSRFKPRTPVHQQRHTQRQGKWEEHHWRYLMSRRPHSSPMIRSKPLFVVGRSPWERSHWSLGHNAPEGPCSSKHTHPSALTPLQLCLLAIILTTWEISVGRQMTVNHTQIHTFERLCKHPQS